jgi:hypothetical protein
MVVPNGLLREVIRPLRRKRLLLGPYELVGRAMPRVLWS